MSSIGHEKNAVSRSAYLLFYRCRQPFSPPPHIELYEDQEEEEPLKEEECKGLGSASHQSDIKEEYIKDSDSLLYMGEDFPDIGENSEKLTDDFGEMSQAGVKTSIQTDTEMLSSGRCLTQGLNVGSSIGIMDQASDKSSASEPEDPDPPGYTDMEAVD